MSDLEQSCLDNHVCFRVLLQSMSRPGTIFQIPGAAGRPAEEALLRLLECIGDAQISCCLLDAAETLEKSLRERTGIRPAGAAEADILVAAGGDTHGLAPELKRGRTAFPDQGATIFFLVEELQSGRKGLPVRLSGPGIRDTCAIAVKGLGAAELETLREVNSEFPLGVDSLFVDRRGRLMSLPRSTRIGGF